MIEFDDDDDAPSGAPAWMATFADLMSLLMCFFVLLLSFSEMDVLKYKQIAGSMKDAFGVQNKVKVKDIPKGTSIIAKEFSPGDPKPTQIKTINQITTDITKQSLKVGNPDSPDTKAKNNEPKDLDSEETKKLLKEKLKALIADTQNDANKLKELLKDEIDEGKIDIESEGRSITIRIREKGTFPSGSATFHADFKSVMATIRDSLKDISGKIAVEGHSDNIPIRSGPYKTNWELSAARALSVTHELILDKALDSNRFMVIGYADTRPHNLNDTRENRAKNRRVEIVIRQGLDDTTTKSLKDIQKSDPNVLDTMGLVDSNLPDDLVEAELGDTLPESSDANVEATPEGNLTEPPTPEEETSDVINSLESE